MLVLASMGIVLKALTFLSRLLELQTFSNAQKNASGTRKIQCMLTVNVQTLLKYLLGQSSNSN